MILELEKIRLSDSRQSSQEWKSLTNTKYQDSLNRIQIQCFLKEEQYIVNLPGQVDNLKRRQGVDASIAQYYEDLKDQIYWRKKSFEMSQKSTDELRELLSLYSKKNFS
jgi:hypothetical protein